MTEPLVPCAWCEAELANCPYPYCVDGYVPYFQWIGGLAAPQPLSTDVLNLLAVANDRERERLADELLAEIEEEASSRVIDSDESG